MKLAFSAATEEVSRMALAWVGPLDEILPKIAEIGYEGVEFQIRDPAEIDLAKKPPDAWRDRVRRDPRELLRLAL